MLAGAIATASLAACGTPATSPAPTSAAAPGSRVLIAYFSRPGENYHYGGRTHLQIGNTERVADMIANSIDADVFRIRASEAYPVQYDLTVDRNVAEQQANARPDIADPLPDMGPHDTVLLGSPIWNVRPPMIMRTFVDSVDLAGKTILPFVTYAVSGLGATVDTYTDACPQSRIGEALAVRGEEVSSAENDVRAWLRRVGLLP